MNKDDFYEILAGALLVLAIASACCAARFCSSCAGCFGTLCDIITCPFRAMRFFYRYFCGSAGNSTAQQSGVAIDGVVVQESQSVESGLGSAGQTQQDTTANRFNDKPPEILQFYQSQGIARPLAVASSSNDIMLSNPINQARAQNAYTRF
ncbi:MAG: hypothetical protein ACKOAD_07880 [Gammaproteobacteria bacterium]